MKCAPGMNTVMMRKKEKEEKKKTTTHKQFQIALQYIHNTFIVWVLLFKFYVFLNYLL